MDPYPFADLFADVQVNHHPWSPEKPGRAEPAGIAVAPGLAADVLPRLSPPKSLTAEAEVSRTVDAKGRVSFVVRVATSQSGLLADGSEVQFVAARDPGVARPCFRLYCAGGVIAGTKLHKLSKQHAAYAGKVQAVDASLTAFSLTAPKNWQRPGVALAAHGETGDGEDDGGFRRHDGSAAHKETAMRKDVPRAVEFGLLTVMAPQEPEFAADAGAGAVGTGGEGQRTDGTSDARDAPAAPAPAPRLRALVPPPDIRTGAARPYVSFDAAESMWATFQKGFAHRFVCLQSGPGCVDNLHLTAMHERPSERKPMAVIDASTAQSHVDALRDTARGFELRVPQRGDAGRRSSSSAAERSAAAPPTLKVWEPLANRWSVEFAAPLTSLHAFAFALAGMAGRPAGGRRK